MKTATWTTIFGALVVSLFTVAVSNAQEGSAADLLQGMLDAVDAEQPVMTPGTGPEIDTPAVEVEDDWEPRPLSDFVNPDEMENVATEETKRDEVRAPVAADELPAETETNIVEALVVEEEPAVETVDPLDEVMAAVKAASNETAVAENDLVEVYENVDEILETTGEEGAQEEVILGSMDEPEIEVDEGAEEIDMGGFDEAQVDRSGQLISVRLNKVGLEEAITLFAQLSGANIIVPELTEAAQISVNLKDVEWRPALQSILDSYNYELYQKVPGSNVYSVRRRPVGAPEPQVVETFKLQYATVPEAVKLVRGLLPPEAKVSEFASRNILVVKSTESAINEIRSVLNSVDLVRQQVFIESKFMELTDSAQKDLGIDWQVLQSYSAGTSGSISEKRESTREDLTTRSTYETAEGQRYDDASGFVNSGTLLGGVPILEGITPSVEDVSTEGTSKVLTSVLSADEFRVVLSALEENKGVNVVSNPKVVVANEEKANISIIRKEPNLLEERKPSLNDQPDLVTYKQATGEEAWFEYGIKLDVTPSINTSSNITVLINPSLTRKFGDKQAGTTTFPIIDEKSIQTVFSLADGQTAAIGGLTEVQDGEEERKVPVLGSIPFIGRLFSWKETVRGQQETIIFVTVGLANTMDINVETGLPEDSELARRQMIRDRNSKTLRKQGRTYYQEEENDKLQDMLKVMREREAKRTQKRAANRGLEDEASLESDLQHAVNL